MIKGGSEMFIKTNERLTRDEMVEKYPDQWLFIDAGCPSRILNFGQFFKGEFNIKNWGNLTYVQYDEINI